jgi:hypothetical protein
MVLVILVSARSSFCRCSRPLIAGVQLQEPGHQQQASLWQTQGQQAWKKACYCAANGSTTLSISVEDIAAVKALADRIGAEKVQALAKVLGEVRREQNRADGGSGR